MWSRISFQITVIYLDPLWGKNNKEYSASWGKKKEIYAFFSSLDYGFRVSPIWITFNLCVDTYFSVETSHFLEGNLFFWKWTNNPSKISYFTTDMSLEGRTLTEFSSRDFISIICSTKGGLLHIRPVSEL